MESKRDVILVTGASSGIGNACATYLGKKGFRIYGCSRNPEKYVQKADEFFEMIKMDVNDDASVKAAVEYILVKEGKIDGLINNAGNGIGGSIEDTSIEEAKYQFETNLFGVIRVIKAVLPSMRKQGSGRIINISSIAGKTGVPFQGLYSASKHAIEGLTETLRIEIRPFGLSACVIEPGDFETGFTASRQMVKAATEASPYYEYCEKAMTVAVHDETHGCKPIQIAKIVHKVLLKKTIRVRYSVGPFVERLALGVKRLVSSKTFERLFRMYYKQ